MACARRRSCCTHSVKRPDHLSARTEYLGAHQEAEGAAVWEEAQESVGKSEVPALADAVLVAVSVELALEVLVGQ